MIDYLDRITDEEATVLSYIRLGGDTSKLDRYVIRREESLGFIHKDNNGCYTVQKEAYPLLSDYPLFGRYKTTRDFESHLVPFVLAAVNEGYIKADESKIRTYFNSDYFTSLFPADKNFSDAAIVIVDSLRKLDIIETSNSYLRLNRDRASMFMELDVKSTISYIISPELEDKERERHVKAIDLLSRLRCIDDLGKYLKVIFNISQYDLTDDIQKLYTLKIIYDDEDGMECVNFNDIHQSNAVVSSDFTLSYTGVCNGNLFFFLKPIKTDTITQWIVDKSTLRSSFSMGYTPAEVISNLQEISLYPLPGTLLSRLEGWYAQFRTIQLKRALVLVTDEKNSRILDSLPLFRRHILSKPAENVFLLNPESESEWRKILNYSGYDMLTDTIGEQFVTKHESKALKSYDSLMPLPVKRDVEFNNEKYKSLLNNAESATDKLLFSYGMFEPIEISMVEGLYFQEKMRVIQDSISKERLLFIEDIESMIDIVSPKEIIHSDDFFILETDKGSLIIDKLWLVAMLPEWAIQPKNQ